MGKAIRFYIFFSIGLLFGVVLTSHAIAQSGDFSIAPPGAQKQQSALPPDAAPPPSPGMALSAEDAFSGNEGLQSPTAQKTVEDIEKEIREQSFNAALTGLLPLKPDEIRGMLEHYDDTRQAVEIPVYPYPEPEIVVETLSLDPGVTPPVLNVAMGHVATLTFMDVTGQPWPIQDMSWAGNFEIIEAGEGTWVLRVTPMSDFAYGNLSVRLLDLKTPVLFTLKTTRDKVHYRFDARIPEYGPYAQAPLIDGGITLVAGNPTINSILDGVPPNGSEFLDVSGVDGRTTAYKVSDLTYVRTPLTLLSPGWSHSVSSSDGMNVYVVANAPVLLLSDQGRMVRARLSERGESDE